MHASLDTPIALLRGVGARRAALLEKELGARTLADLIVYYPFRYEDRSRTYLIGELSESMSHAQIRGKIVRIEARGEGRSRRLTARFRDDSGELELVWFNGIAGVQRRIKPHIEYVAFGKPMRYAARLCMAHPELEPAEGHAPRVALQPVYSISERLRAGYLNNRYIASLLRDALNAAMPHIAETLPPALLRARQLTSRAAALADIHFPASPERLAAAQRRLKFEELFYIQIQLLRMKLVRRQKYPGLLIDNPQLLTRFYTERLPFALTGAQKRVIHEIYADLKSGWQMNRLLQGDVGSGKTIVAFACMLLVVGSGAQCALMAPTEILAQQHYATLKPYADALGISIALLTGAVRRAARRPIYDGVQSGELSILVGTHAVIESEVSFARLGLAVIDEQHRFGVAQRSKLWTGRQTAYPHALVMTATPIPRTLAMTLYGDLDVSVIDELPAGRKSIKTVHRSDAHRLRINEFIRTQIRQGRQAYVVYPLIEESEKLDLKHLMDGYESMARALPDTPLSIVHGKMTSEAKAFEMERFISGQTKVMVATTVIEVGVDVPNASVMVVESAERFGLSQLHQLRGRVGRGTAQSYCILVTGHKLSADARVRMETMEKTNDGFEIAEVDLRLRGPGDLTGTQQSGALNLRIADLSKDGLLLREAREEASRILAEDPELKHSDHAMVLCCLTAAEGGMQWSRVG